MKLHFSFIKTTIIGGLLFLVPVVILIMIFDQVYGLMLEVAEPLGDLIPIDNIGGVALANIIVVILILLICFISGLFARRRAFSSFHNYIERKLLIKIPGYGFVKGITSSIKAGTEASKTFLPVLVRIQDYEQMGFEIERTHDKRVVVYLPGAPVPWAGRIIYTAPEKVSKLPISVPDAIGHIEQLGMGSSRLFGKE